MAPEATGNLKLGDEDLGFDILQDIEKQTSENIKKMRTTQRVTIKAKVVLQSGNSSELLSYKIQGVMGDISAGGCGAMFPIPAKVGDIYRLSFPDGDLDLPMLFARCIRCRLVKEDAYEAGFTFFSPIRLPDTLTGGEAEDLL
jgi:c-di-GMP-binding flagellar brake protein YcgR